METPARSHRRRWPLQSQFFFYGLLFLTLFLTWLVLRPFVVYTFAGIFVAILSLPIDHMWERVFRMDRQATPRARKRRDRLAATATIFTLILILAVPLGVVGWLATKEVQALAQSVEQGRLDDGIDHAIDFFQGPQNETSRNETRAQILDRIGAKAREIATRAANEAGEIVGQMFVALTIILFVVYYLLIDGDVLLAYLGRISPLPPRQFDFLIQEAHRGVVGVFVGQMLTAGLQGIVAGIGYFVAQVPAALLWTMLTAIFSLVPAIGTALIWVPLVAFLLAIGKVWQAVFLATWGLLVVSQIDNFVRPKLISYKSDIHPVFVLIGLLGGVAAFGFIGLFLGPLLVGVTISVLRVWERDYKDPATHRAEGHVPAEAEEPMPDG